MALSPEARASQGGVRTLADGSPDTNLSGGAVRSLANSGPDLVHSGGIVRGLVSYPADHATNSQGAVRAFTGSAPDMLMPSGIVRVLIRGRVSRPTIRAWPFSLDGHDFYVLRLGTGPTLVFDTMWAHNPAAAWSVWGSGDGDPWRAYTGRNWLAGRKLALPWSNVVVGDDGTGALYFLSPDDSFDDHPVTGAPQPFTRQLTGQIVISRGYASHPCYGVQLFGSIGSTAGLLTVNLAISDDGGRTYDDMGGVGIGEGDRYARLDWHSLGSMTAPGRLFRVSDTGALKRIDGLEMIG